MYLFVPIILSVLALCFVAIALYLVIAAYPEDAGCTCKECVDMCKHRPCLPTPKEADKLMDKGYASRLMLDWYKDINNIYIYIVSPALCSFEGKYDPDIPTGRCTFLTDKNLCLLHDLKLKPMEGRLALHGGKTPENLHEDIAKMWDSALGRKVVQRWISAKGDTNVRM
jgi:hypothetical protein